MDSQSRKELFRTMIELCTRMMDILQEEIDASESSIIALPTPNELIPTPAPISIPAKTSVNNDSTFLCLEPAENGAGKSVESHAFVAEGSNHSTVADSVTEVVDEGKEPLADKIFKHLAPVRFVINPSCFGILSDDVFSPMPLNAISYSDSRICFNFILPSPKPVRSSYCEFETFASSTSTSSFGKTTVSTIAATPPQPPHSVLVFDPDDIKFWKEKQSPIFCNNFQKRPPPPKPPDANTCDVDCVSLTADATRATIVVDAPILDTEPHDPGPRKSPSSTVATYLTWYASHYIFSVSCCFGTAPNLAIDCIGPPEHYILILHDKVVSNAWVLGFIGASKYVVVFSITVARDIAIGDFVSKPPIEGPILWEIGIPDPRFAAFFLASGIFILKNLDDESFEGYLWQSFELPSVWNIGLNLLVATDVGIISLGLIFHFKGIAMHKKGPKFFTNFIPLMRIIVVTVGSFNLAETLSLIRIEFKIGNTCDVKIYSIFLLIFLTSKFQLCVRDLTATILMHAPGKMKTLQDQQLVPDMALGSVFLYHDATNPTIEPTANIEYFPILKRLHYIISMIINEELQILEAFCGSLWYYVCIKMLLSNHFRVPSLFAIHFRMQFFKNDMTMNVDSKVDLEFGITEHRAVATAFCFIRHCIPTLGRNTFQLLGSGHRLNAQFSSSLNQLITNKVRWQAFFPIWVLQLPKYVLAISATKFAHRAISNKGCLAWTLLVFKLGLGHVGATLAIGVSYWLLVLWFWTEKYTSFAWIICGSVVFNQSFLSPTSSMNYVAPEIPLKDFPKYDATSCVLCMVNCDSSFMEQIEISTCVLGTLVIPQVWRLWSDDFVLKTIYYGELENLGPVPDLWVLWSSKVPADHGLITDDTICNIWKEWQNSYNLEDKVVFNGGSNVMIENNNSGQSLEKTNSVRGKGQVEGDAEVKEVRKSYRERKPNRILEECVV